MKVNILLTTLVVGFILGWCAKPNDIKYSNHINTPDIIVESNARVITRNVFAPVYLNKYLVRTVTVNQVVVKEVIITSANAVEVANDLRSDVLAFETSPLNVTIDPYVITDGLPPNNLNMSVNLHR